MFFVIVEIIVLYMVIVYKDVFIVFVWLFFFRISFKKFIFMFYFLKVSVFKYNNIDIYCKFIGKKSVESDVSINIFSKIWFYE